MTYRIEFQTGARRSFDALDGVVRSRITLALARLAQAPRSSPNVKAMTDGNYRLRVGDWRVVYALHDDVLMVLVLRVGHRRDVNR